MEPQQLKQLEYEAYARITWGDSPADVRAWLLSMEVRDFYVEALLRDCLKRRAREMRALGVRNFLFAIGAILAGLILGVGGWLLVDWLDRQGIRAPALYAVPFVPAAIFFGYGTWQLWLALDRLVFGSRADGAVSDVE